MQLGTVAHGVNGPPGRILAVSFRMPPLLTARSLQVARTLKQLRALGWECTVLSVDPASLRNPGRREDPSLELVYRDVFPIVRTGTPENRRPFLWLRRLVLGLRVPGAQALQSSKLLWAPTAIREGKRLLASRDDFSIIVSFAAPRASHVVGLALARASRLPWVAHFSDPWSDSPYFRGGPFSRWLLDRLEQQTIRTADRVVFVAERTADLVMRKYPATWRSKVRVIPHGYDTDLLPPIPADTPPPRLRLVHTGAFYGQRTPAALLQALALLDQQRPVRNRLEVIFVGPRESPYQRTVDRLGLTEIVRFPGRLPHRETLRVAAEADVCLVLDAPSDGESVFLPSKIVDYLMLRKPILGFTPPRGESADLLRRLGCPVVAPDDVPAIAEAVDGLLRAWEANALRLPPDYERVAAEYDVRHTTRLFDGVLREAQQRSAIG
jgi:glycosyltransferase involved in cell wall biosynthesis